MKVKALRSFYCDGAHNAGDVYEAQADHVQLLLCAKCIELVAEPVPIPVPVKAPPAVTPPPKPKPRAEVDWSTRYKRRDMKAEE
jgi:hypothetical protein